jgi:putative transcriptional regulator
MPRSEPDLSVEGDTHGVRVHLDVILVERGMTLTELAEAVGITLVKNGRAKAIRFSTLTGICRALDCQPGQILTVDKD